MDNWLVAGNGYGARCQSTDVNLQVYWLGGPCVTYSWKYWQSSIPLGISPNRVECARVFQMLPLLAFCCIFHIKSSYSLQIKWDWKQWAQSKHLKRGLRISIFSLIVFDSSMLLCSCHIIWYCQLNCSHTLLSSW